MAASKLHVLVATWAVMILVASKEAHGNRNLLDSEHTSVSCTSMSRNQWSVSHEQFMPASVPVALQAAGVGSYHVVFLATSSGTDVKWQATTKTKTFNRPCKTLLAN